MCTRHQHSDKAGPSIGSLKKGTRESAHTFLSSGRGHPGIFSSKNFAMRPRLRIFKPSTFPNPNAMLSNRNGSPLHLAKLKLSKTWIGQCDWHNWWFFLSLTDSRHLVCILSWEESHKGEVIWFVRGGRRRQYMVLHEKEFWTGSPTCIKDSVLFWIFDLQFHFEKYKKSLEKKANWDHMDRWETIPKIWGEKWLFQMGIVVSRAAILHRVPLIQLEENGALSPGSSCPLPTTPAESWGKHQAFPTGGTFLLRSTS